MSRLDLTNVDRGERGESRPTKGEGRVQGASTKGEGWVAWVASRRVKRNREEKFLRLRLFLENLPYLSVCTFSFLSMHFFLHFDLEN